MITVLAPGTRTLIEDTGRFGYEHLGVPTSGAADPTTLATANILVGNAADAAAFEVTLHGPTLTFSTTTTVAYAGPEAPLTLNGSPVPNGHTLCVSPGDVLAVGALRTGMFGYLAVAGSLDIEPTLGSKSTCTLSGLGPTPLREGDTLATIPTLTPRRALIPGPRTRTPDASNAAIRFVAGPHVHLFDSQALRHFASTLWAVDPCSSRAGIRLRGSGLTAPQASLPSLGMVTGAVQVTPSGTPIVLGPDHGTTGGYPVIATVLPEDLVRLVQSRAETVVRFVQVDSTYLDAPLPAASASVINLDAISN